MRYDAVAFDVDGTLYPDAALRVRAFLPLLRHPLFFLAFSRARSSLHAEARGADGTGLPRDLEAFRSHQASLAAARLGIDPDRAKALAEELIYRRVPELFRGLRPFAGARPCLEALKASGLALAALSDFPCEEKLVHLGLAECFGLALTSESSGRLKPSPRAFLDLADRLGLPPGRLLYVGNSPRLDVAGARGAGMDTALVIPRGGPFPKGSGVPGDPDLAFSDWADLTSFVLS